MEFKFCKDCKHYIYISPTEIRCGHEKAAGGANLEKWLVDGEGVRPAGYLCVSMRAGICGREATYFEPKE